MLTRVSGILDLIRRASRKPPQVILRRAHQELKSEWERFAAPVRGRNFGLKHLLAATERDSIGELHDLLASQAGFGYLPGSKEEYSTHFNAGLNQLLIAADRALRNEVELLGSGQIFLGRDIAWNKDYKSGISWPNAYCKSIRYVNPDDASDVKFPWELSRMQWMIPVGQAFALTNDEKYARFAKEVLTDWIRKNPYAQSVNWTCTMEVALRILVWTWFFQVFNRSAAWQDTAFLERFISSLFLHAEFTSGHLEYSDINGNHYTADASGLVFAGLFFRHCRAGQSWLRQGWDILQSEILRQVFPDGVNFEASTAYHRLVLELFLYPAIFRQKCELTVPLPVGERILAMARFTRAYTRKDGNCPLWGDADNGRALPFGQQNINDHRYLVTLVGFAFGDAELQNAFPGTQEEAYWIFGKKACQGSQPSGAMLLKSEGFSEGGFYIMRNKKDHIFIDCGPVGLAGRGGHGHNDCLSLEAMLDDVELIRDSGTYLYTASFEERNNFRSTGYHNTPQVDGEEINRFVRPDYLWNLQNDASPQVRLWRPGAEYDIFCGSHTGYLRLLRAVRPVRTITLDHKRHSLIIEDHFEGEGEHEFSIRLHLSTGVTAALTKPGTIVLGRAERQFVIAFQGEGDWTTEITTGRVAPSYGVTSHTHAVLWRCAGPAEQVALKVVIGPEAVG